MHVQHELVAEWEAKIAAVKAEAAEAQRKAVAELTSGRDALQAEVTSLTARVTALEK